MDTILTTIPGGSHELAIFAVNLFCLTVYPESPNWYNIAQEEDLNHGTIYQ